MMYCKTFVCFSVLATFAQAQFTLVQVEQGPVQGYVDSSGEIIEFINLPYATTPQGRDRFKPPLPPPVWTEPFEAVDRGIACPQSGTADLEDCLVANIYTPALTNSTDLTVVVYVHGGGYHVRSGTYNSVKALVRTQNIIAITFNYRLGAHGFLCLGTEDVPGNAGMKDQVALVRWVKRNIANFGGNPEDIVLMGCSAGGGSVDFLTLSPMLAGQFTRAVIQSGCNMGAVGIQLDPLENAKMYARMLNFANVDDIEAVEEFYRTIPVEDLVSLTGELAGRPISTIPFAPCVERDVGQEMFLHDTPVNIIRNGEYTSVPLLYGFTNMEGGMRQGNFDVWSTGMNERFADFIIEDLEFESEEEKDEVAQHIKEYYFGDQPVSTENAISFVDYFTDILFFYPMLRSMKLRNGSTGQSIYLFEYSFYDEATTPIQHTDVRGAGHCAQDDAVLRETTDPSRPEFERMKEIMREYWFSFILTGNPNAPDSTLPTWPLVNASWSPIMSLGRTVELNDTLPKLERALFWEEIYEKNYRTPVPPNVTPKDESNGTNVCTANIPVITLAYLCKRLIDRFMIEK